MKSAPWAWRLLARLLDLALVALLHQIAGLMVPLDWPWLFSYLGYELMVPLLGGVSLGKFLTGLKVQRNTEQTAAVGPLVARELILFLLGPLVALGACRGPWLHDRILATQVVHG
ncbi:MAG: RDD family protein [bacterium]|nr:RDD family protein [bacterium]